MSVSEPKNIDSLPFFFIIGRPRSGTTLLQLFFDAHPNVQIPSECLHIWQLHTKYSSVINWDNKRLWIFLVDFTKTVFFTFKKFDIIAIQKDLIKLSENLNYSAICKVIAKHFISTFNKSNILLFGDKNPFYSQCFDDIFPLINNSKFIHLIRDPRDNHISIFNSRFSIPSITHDTLYWKNSILTIDKYKQKYPEKFYTIKYEDLVEYPEKYLKQICEFLGIPYFSEMINYHEKLNKEHISNMFPFEKSINENFQSIAEPINKSKIGQWKSRLSNKSVKKAEYIAGELLELYGYERKYGKIDVFTKLTTIPGRLYYVYIELINKYIKLRLPKLVKLKVTSLALLSHSLIWKIFVKEGKKL